MAQTIGLAILNLVVFVGLAPLVDGLMRKLRATLHSRQGPPITQPYLDFLKLLGKEDLSPASAVSFIGLIWRLTPALCLGATMTAVLFVPLLGNFSPLGFSGDVIVFIYLLGLAAAAIVLGGFASGNTYAFIGASREVMTIMTSEPVMAIALVAIALKAKSFLFADLITQQTLAPSVSGAIAAIAFLLAFQAQVGKLPFDIPEAETEIMGGTFIERSGPGLALFKLSFQIKTFLLAFLMVSIFIPWPAGNSLPLIVGTILNMVKAGIVLALLEVGQVANPRLRIDQSMVYYTRIVIFVSVVALIFAAIGK
jgi:formate hydrogenlyase subunit 4